MTTINIDKSVASSAAELLIMYATHIFSTEDHSYFIENMLHTDSLISCALELDPTVEDSDDYKKMLSAMNLYTSNNF